MSNPFHNPWSKNKEQQQGYSGPAYGNAYEDNSNLVSNPNMPSPNTNNGFTSSGYYNAWGQEEQTPPQSYPSPQITQPSPYQYTGTPHGNTTSHSDASPYSKHPPSTQPAAHLPPPSAQSETSTSRFERNKMHEEGAVKEPKGKPNKWRILLRFVIFICSVGHLGFAAGARPYSGENVPFSTTSCFYYLFVVAALSIIYSGYHLLLASWRFMTNKSKMNRPIMLGIDVLFAVLWGIGIIIEIAKYRCTWGGKFCSFYNVSIFWGFVAFVAYILSSFWDLVGGCTRRRK